MLYVLILTSLTSFAAKIEHKAHAHKAHAHGAAKMSIAFEAAKGKLTFESPAESIYGFEHVAKSTKDKQKQEAALVKLESSIAQMVVFEKQLNCIFTKEKIEIIQSGSHAEVAAEFAVACEKDPMGSTVQFHIQSVFPKLKDVAVQFIAGDMQKAVEATKNGIHIELKK